MPERRTPTRAVVAALALLAPLLAGCGGDDDGPPPVPPSPTEALWNPCDALDAEGVARSFGGAVTEQNGTPTEPRCAFFPDRKGDPVVDANYQLFPEGLEAAWRTMGRSETATVTRPKMPDAEDTRLVVEVDHGQLFVSGFVQNGILIQTVDAVDPAPYDRQRVVRAVTWAMRELAAHARKHQVS